MSGKQGKADFVIRVRCLFGLAIGLSWINGAVPPVFAQDATETHVEMWYGMRRVDSVALTKSPTTPQQEPVRVPLLPPVKKENHIVAPATPGPVAPPAAIVPPREQSPSVPPTTRSSLLIEQAKTPASVAHGETSVVLNPLPINALPVAPQNGGGIILPAGDGPYGLTLVPLLCVLVAVIAGPLLGVLSFWLLLRRYRQHPAGPVRVDFSAAPIYGVTVPSASTAVCQPSQPDVAPRQVEKSDVPSTAAPVAITAAPAIKAEAFDLGPMYADVAQRKQDALLRHEEGILRYLVEENVKLMEQIGQFAYS